MSPILDTYETNTWISHISEDARRTVARVHFKFDRIWYRTA